MLAIVASLTFALAVCALLPNQPLVLDPKDATDLAAREGFADPTKSIIGQLVCAAALMILLLTYIIKNGSYPAGQSLHSKEDLV